MLMNTQIHQQILLQKTCLSKMFPTDHPQTKLNLVPKVQRYQSEHKHSSYFTAVLQLIESVYEMKTKICYNIYPLNMYSSIKTHNRVYIRHFSNITNLSLYNTKHHTRLYSCNTVLYEIRENDARFQDNDALQLPSRKQPQTKLVKR